MKFVIGRTEHERLEVRILGYSCDNYDNEYDANWLHADANISVGVFSGHISFYIMTSDLISFTTQADRLYANLTGVAELNLLEDQLKIQMKGDGHGHIDVKGHVKDAVGMGYNTLKYAISIDQTELKMTIDELKLIMDRYPERKV